MKLRHFLLFDLVIQAIISLVMTFLVINVGFMTLIALLENEGSGALAILLFFGMIWLFLMGCWQLISSAVLAFAYGEVVHRIYFLGASLVCLLLYFGFSSMANDFNSIFPLFLFNEASLLFPVILGVKLSVAAIFYFRFNWMFHRELTN